jgi:hypothetical protein
LTYGHDISSLIVAVYAKGDEMGLRYHMNEREKS